jgi:hypothetical protein
MFIPAWLIILFGLFLLWVQHRHKEALVRVSAEAYDRGEQAGRDRTKREAERNLESTHFDRQELMKYIQSCPRQGIRDNIQPFTEEVIKKEIVLFRT